ncbi:P-loop containing nucleoside triphosphate hydrolase protein [Annulohypoxylon maeteangense]|uniref:P-loop containing nucleoside triphosphate hydrolase protein n=1 Tax=Annulohypoxylon maeteangense TaxID=1927788 RepID=UPI00200876C1|nr:P-loop containing nucleoside triphosphate hydrolase protein [Annulohypoxylon maeteangense]KAI0887763.1 P-loop containing nucleoside triphosphate hydrolase protein [Annulohypoxylon maeteangense]
MSGDTEPDGDGYVYGFQNRIRHDRHIQNIIDHTNTLFPGRNYQFPRFDSSSRANEEGMFVNQLRSDREDEELDEFDRNLLGRPQRSSHLQSSEYSDRRLSLPLSNTPTQPRRVLGDASHHFGNFTARDAEHQSPFSSDTIRAGSIKPSPASRRLSERDGIHRMRELQLEAQMATPPFHTAPNLTPNLENAHSSSSPMNLSGSSPSARSSLRQRPRTIDRPTMTQKRASNLNLNLTHASGEPPSVKGVRLIDPRQALPDKFRVIFPYELFNVVQSKSFKHVYETDDNVVVSAPTGSGKTAILEMAICKLIMGPGSENHKIVYQAPTKSLCSERAKDWQKKFSHMNLQCIELTGDTSQAQASRVGSASIIVTTPEKWDSITRKWSDHRRLLDMVRLVLIDEVHILKDVRGATLEAVVSRMKTIGANVRFVALSATVPNIEDVAKWLGRNHSNQREMALTEAFGEELRPVKLQRYVYGYDAHHNDFTFEKALDQKLTSLLSKHSQKKPIMVFCFARKSCEITARKLAEWWSNCSTDDKAWPAPTRRVPVINRELQEIVQYGVAFHHAGLDASDRSAIAQGFLDGHVHVICCTSTLAVGVNLPCHTVVLKGTTGYFGDKLQEYSDLEVMQMLGRAGRPQFDDSAVAIIMTKKANINRYKKMMSGEETLESMLHRNLVEHLNSEISLGTIQEVQTAKKWIKGTFLNVRVCQAPWLYDIKDVRTTEDIEMRMEEWCERDVKLLQQFGLVTEQVPFQCTEYGHAMSRYMVNFDTMKQLLSIPTGAPLKEILTTLSKAIEFKDFRFKPDERAMFRELNKSPFILYPIKETLTQTWHKVFLMVQVHLGGVELPSDKGFGHLRQRVATEKNAIFDRLNRLVRCFVDCRVFDKDGLSTKAGLELIRGIVANSWEDKPSQLSQIPGFGPVMVRKWVSHGVYTVLELADRDFSEIERISSKNPPYGINLLKTLEKFPRLDMKTRLISPTIRLSQPEESVSVTLEVNLRYCNAGGVPTWNNRIPAVTFVVLTTNGDLAYFWRGNLTKINKSAGLDLRFPVSLNDPDQKISCYFSCEEIVGTQVMRVLEPGIPQAAFKSRKTPLIKQPISTMNPLDDDIDYDDLPDEDMLGAALAVGQDDEVESLSHTDQVDSFEDEIPFVDDLLSFEEGPSAFEPTQMDNGKWMCNHRCRNAGLTTTGRPCTHRCCHEGLDKPRPPPREKKKIQNKHNTVDDNTKGKGSAVRPSTNMRAPQADVGFGPDGGKEKRIAKPTSRINGSSTTLPNMKRKRLTADKTNEVQPWKRRKPIEYSSDLDSLSDIECIDLTTTVDNEVNISPLKISTSSNTTNLQRQNKLNQESKTDPSLKIVNTKTQALSNPSGQLDGAPRISSKVDAKSDPANCNTHYDSDIFDQEDEDEFPDVESLIRLSELKDTGKSQVESSNDETLYPGVVHTLKESMEYG